MEDKTKENLIWYLLFFSSFIALYTEILSYLNLINKTSIILGWVGFLFIIFFYKRPYLGFDTLKKFFLLFSKSYFNFFIFLLILIIFIICLIYPPNNSDALSYRLPRVENWIQNKNLEIFATPDLRQVMYPSFSEYVILHLKLIFNSDYFINLIQLLSFLGSVLTVSMILDKLGNYKLNKIYSLIFCATIPMGILQSNSSQNDYLVTIMVLICIYFLLCFLKEKKLKNIIGFSIALSIATLTKPTAYIYLFPFCLWLFIEIIKHKTKYIHFLLFIPIIYLIFNLGYFSRNIELFNLPLGVNTGITNEVINIKVVLSNLIRNLSLNLTLPFVEFNSLIRDAVSNFHKLIELPINDQINTFSTKGRFGGEYFIYFSLFENNASNFLHFIIILFIILTSYIFFKENQILKIYILCTVMSFVLFSIILKWQPWGNRLLLTFFVLFSPIICFIPANSFFKKTIHLISFLLILYSLPYLFMNKTRPLVGTLYREGEKIYYDKPKYLNFKRDDLYFIHERKKEDNFYKNQFEIIDKLNSINCRFIGLDSSETELEYMIWLLLSKLNYKDKIVFHLDVNNLTNSKLKNHKPCAVFLLDKNDKKDEKYKQIFKNNINLNELNFYY